ncbi:hypothetical protein NX871_16965, partial [Burkholderia thailandensis]|uniref:hypothetical protein n=1 Tax=Burkholderia thailandensis TaxID=57975 RepID=UPI00217E7005
GGLRRSGRRVAGESSFVFRRHVPLVVWRFPSVDSVAGGGMRRRSPRRGLGSALGVAQAARRSFSWGERLAELGRGAPGIQCRTSNVERRTSNVERRTPNVERLEPGTRTSGAIL